MPRTVLFVANTFPHPVADFLAEDGYNVREVLPSARAEELAARCTVDALIIAAGNSYPGSAELRRRSITLDLAIHATGRTDEH